MIRHLALIPGLVLGAAAMPAAAQTGDQASPTTRADLLKSIDTNFKRIDADSDGALSKAEIDTAQQRARDVASANIEKRFEGQFTRLDTNKDGQLSLAEFKAAAPDAKVRTDAADEALGRFDADKDGKVTEAELSAAIQRTMQGG